MSLKCGFCSLALAIIAAGCTTKPKETTPTAPATPLGKVTAILSVTLEGRAALQTRTSGKLWSALHVEQQVGLGSEIRTPPGVQARLDLKDGTVLRLNESTQLTFEASRKLSLKEGELLAEVSPGGEANPFYIETPVGHLRVTGTKLNVQATEDHTTVDVTRGLVEVTGSGTKVEVGAGERAEVKAGAAPRVNLSRDLADVTRWSREVGSFPGNVENLNPGFGSLKARVPGQGKSFSLKLASHQVRVTIQDNIARTEIEQSYYNSSSQTLEGTYRFPLPEGASISRLALYVGKRLEEGEIVERKRARQIFRKIVEDTIRPRDPALLEWVGGQTFQMKIFPIPPRSARRVILAYTQPLSASYGKYRYVYPMATDQGKATKIGKFSVDLKVDSSRGLGKVSTPLYPALKEKDPSGATRLRYEASDFVPARSFVVNFAPESDPPELQLALYQRPKTKQEALQQLRALSTGRPQKKIGDRGGFFMTVLRPELPTEGRANPKDYLFLMDSSYSTGKQGWALQLAALEAFLMEMDLRSRFNIMACDTKCRTLGEAFRQPSVSERKAALLFARGITPGGSSYLQGAFSAAATLLKNKGVQAHVVYMGDGRPTVGELREPELAREVVNQMEGAKATLSALQIGEDVGEFFLAEATRRLAGSVNRISAGDDIGNLVFDIVAAQFRPTLTDLEVTYEGVDVHHTYPKTLASLTAGSEAIIVGRYKTGGKGVVRLKGKLAGRPFERRYPLSFEAGQGDKNANSFIPRIWAKHHLDALSMDNYKANRSEIVRVSKAYTVLSRATAFLVLENERMYKEFGVKRKRNRTNWKGAPVSMKTGRDQPEKADQEAESGKESKSAGLDKLSSSGISGALSRGAGGSKKGTLGAAPESAMQARSADSFRKRKKSAPSAAMRSRQPKPRRADAPPPSRFKSYPMTKQDHESLVDPFDAMPKLKKRPASAPRPDMIEAPVRSSKPPLHQRSRLRSPPVRVFKATITPIVTIPISVRQQRKIESLRQKVAAHPHKRYVRTQYHRALIKAGRYEQALEHAKKWTELDGANAASLRALGSIQSIRVGAETAMKTFAAAIEVEPWNTRLHKKMAGMYKNKGDQELSCAHLWSVMSIAPHKAQRHLDLATCLASIKGQRDQAVVVLSKLAASKPGNRMMSRIGKSMLEIQRPDFTPPRPKISLKGDLIITATWNRPVDLDLVLITPKGEIISAIQGGRRAKVEIDSHQGDTAEVLRARRLPSGRYYVAISRSNASSSDSISGTILVKARGNSQVIPFILGETSKPLAQVKIARVMRRR